MESTQPTKSLMRIAEYIDTSDLKDELRPWILNRQSEVLELLAAEEARVNSLKEKRGLGEPGSTSESGLRRRRNKVGGEAPKTTVDMSNSLDKVGTFCP